MGGEVEELRSHSTQHVCRAEEHQLPPTYYSPLPFFVPFQLPLLWTEPGVGTAETKAYLLPFGFPLTEIPCVLPLLSLLEV